MGKYKNWILAVSYLVAEVAIILFFTSCSTGDSSRNELIVSKESPGCKIEKNGELVCISSDSTGRIYSDPYIDIIKENDKVNKINDKIKSLKKKFKDRYKTKNKTVPTKS